MEKVLVSFAGCSCRAPSRNRNPSPRLNYWTPGNPVTGISYPGSMNTIFGFVEPSHPGLMPFPPMNSIPYMWQPTPPPPPTL